MVPILLDEAKVSRSRYLCMLAPEVLGGAVTVLVPPGFLAATMGPGLLDRAGPLAVSVWPVLFTAGVEVRAGGVGMRARRW